MIFKFSIAPLRTNRLPTSVLDDAGVRMLTKLFNKVYTGGKMPTEWLKSYFITLPKKPSAKVCVDFRTISLLSHVLKVYYSILK